PWSSEVRPLGRLQQSGRPGAAVGRFARNLAGQDWLMAIYVLVLLGAVLHGSGPRRGAAISGLLMDFVGLASVLILVRGEILKPSGFASLIYRFALMGSLLGSFFQLQYVLPTATHYALDAQIYSLDKAVFGFEPAEVWDRFVTPATTDWFSFFYYGYFLILAAHVLPFMFFARDMEIFGEFSFGILFLFCVGHTVYLLVPGYGPYLYLAGHFHHALNGPFFWRLVKETVDSVDGAARKDIFPSLHTAAPTFLALFSFRHRRAMPFKLTWPLLAVFASQIIIATMFLRWHYLIDICAGITLAGSSVLLARTVAAREHRKREKFRLPPLWTPLSFTRTVAIAQELPLPVNAADQGPREQRRLG
ncbi:MAG: phosphatase PAP2 family protein, partial [Polyangiales bacterium]